MFFEAGKKFLNPKGLPINKASKKELNIPQKRSGTVHLNKESQQETNKKKEEQKKKGCC